MEDNTQLVLRIDGAVQPCGREGSSLRCELSSSEPSDMENNQHNSQGERAGQRGARVVAGQYLGLHALQATGMSKAEQLLASVSRACSQPDYGQGIYTDECVLTDVSVAVCSGGRIDSLYLLKTEFVYEG
ncbi:hypothetical protein NDU88_010583 [Pleurodeles waltl]|uniref:Uncharacterized protein n=1 Tax=Pleurodeles waltl TaxID=8319 RepID=A0AAV7QUU9_PLEWA|nr:hypothetical protein NDU88_010583 [Pleurodeles waltl]